MLRAALTSMPFLVGFAAMAQPNSYPPPIEPAGKGMLQCHQPNHARKTCQSLAGYRLLADGVVENTAWVGLPTMPVTVMEVVSKATIRDERVCGSILQSDVDAAHFAVEGVEVDGATTADYRKRVTVLYASMMDREICTAYVADGDTLISRPFIDGVAVPQMSQRVVWVSPEDGYRVGQ
jgi:hypothetical protein